MNKGIITMTKPLHNKARRGLSLVLGFLMVFTTVAVMLPPVTAHAAPTLTEIYKGVTFSQESVKNDTDANADANVNTHVIKVDIKGGHVKFRIGIPNDATAPVPGDLQRTTCLNKNGKPE